MSSREVICIKWGNKYAAEDVNRLYCAVRRSLDDEFSFWCVTDDPSALLPEVQRLALPAVPVVGRRNDRGWRKLALFAPALGGPSGDTLYLDLDVLITAPLKPFFERPGPFHIIEDYRLIRFRNRFAGNSSVMRYRPADLSAVYAALLNLGESVTRRYRNEQEFLSDFVRERGMLAYWPHEWCASFKHDCVWPVPFGLWRTPRLPSSARVVVFHGRPKPQEAIVGGVGSKWYRPVRAAPWVAHHLSPPQSEKG